MITHVSTRPEVERSLLRRRPLRRAIAAGASLIAAGTLATLASTAGAAPQPSVDQVRKTVDKLTSAEDQAIQQYDQAAQELTNAQQRLALVNTEVSLDRAHFKSMRAEIAAIASTAFESGTMTSMGALLTSNDPQAVLSQASVLLQMSSDRSAQINEFISAARQLAGVQRTARRTEQAIATLDSQRLVRKKAIGTALAKQKAMLDSLTTAQQQAVAQTATIGVGGSTTAKYTGPTGTQAQQAVAYAYSKLGDAYVYGATGPSTFDCSGLAQAAWASAGVSIPRTTYAQVAALPSVPISSIQPGDLLFFDGDGHVGIYVGGGYLIDAPTTGSFVEKVALAGWYRSNLDSAARP